MTSKNLFPDLLKENRKRRLWPLALSILASIFSLPVLSILCMDNWTERLIAGMTTLADIRISFCNTVAGAGNIAVFICAMSLALICGINSMAYLHSKGKTDLYGSLPVKRTQVFGAAYLNGLLFFAVPFFAAQMITLILGAVRGMFVLSSLPGILLSSLYVMIFYFSTYTLVCLAAVLSGNTVVSVALSGVILFVAPLGYLAYYSYASVFFRSFYQSSESIIWRYLSPVLTYFWISVNKLSSEFEKNDVEFSNSALAGAVLMLVVGVVVLYLILTLIRKRPAESAGNAFSFKWVRPVFKIILMVVGTLLISLLFYEVSPSRNLGWLLFGFAAGLILIHAVVEIVCEFDFKACLHHPLSFIVGALLSAFIIFSFMFDFFGYDSYLPPVSMVESAALSSYDLQPTITYNDPEGRGYYVGSDEYRLKNMALKDIEAVYTLAEKGIEFNNEVHKRSLLSISRPGSIYTNNDVYAGEDDIRYTNITLRLRLRNGGSIYRSYYINMSDKETFDAYSKIYETWEYKEAVYPVLNAKAADLGRLRLCDDRSVSSLILTEKEREKLLRVYRQDMLEFEGKRLKEEIPCAEITSTKQMQSEDEGSYYEEEYDFVIYPSFKRCAQLLGEARKNPDYRSEDVLSVDVNWYNTKVDYYDSRNISYEMPKDSSKIEELLSVGVRSEAFREADAFMEDLNENDDGYRMEVYFASDPYDANVYSPSIDYILPGGTVPEFLEKDMGE